MACAFFFATTTRLSTSLSQPSALQHLHLPLARVRIQNAFLCRGFSHAEDVWFTEPHPMAASVGGGAASLWLVSKCRAVATEVEQRWARGSAPRCNSACSHHTRFPAPRLFALLTAALAARSRSNSSKRRRERLERGRREGLAFGSPGWTYPGFSSKCL